MNITIKKSLFLYCYKADNYYDYIRRSNILARYIRRQFDKRYWRYVTDKICRELI